MAIGPAAVPGATSSSVPRSDAGVRAAAPPGNARPAEPPWRRALARVRPALVLVLAAPLACSLPRWPAHGPITSPYGLRMDGLLPEVHHGVDIALPDGTPVRAMKGGRVRHAGPLGGYGLAVIIEHGPALVTLYGHLSQVRVRPGEEVEGRQVIGLSGRSGNASGPHLHFEVRRWGRPEDPVPLLGGPP
ncbi:MAG TPA: M23 family metallopeptidase [Longimicrobiales bacterium]